jgi:hypothetical protein
MYGDDDRTSWPNDNPLQGVSRAELGYRSVGRSSRESSTYYTATAKSQRSSNIGAAFRASSGSGSSSTDTSSPYIGIEEDFSTDAHPELPPIPPPKPPQRFNGSGSSRPNLDGTVDVTSPQSRYLSPSPPHSRPSSSRSHASSALNGHSSTAPRSPHGPPSERASVTSPSSRLISRPGSQTTATSTSPRLLSRRRSDLSITPSAGEDPDSFHVRSTYAQLDIFGVKGDGIEEGVERTRARVGGSRESELKAMNAVGDEDERRRDLSPQELQMLSSLDR